MEITDDYFGVLQAVIVHQVLQLWKTTATVMFKEFMKHFKCHCDVIYIKIVSVAALHMFLSPPLSFQVLPWFVYPHLVWGCLPTLPCPHMLSSPWFLIVPVFDLISVCPFGFAHRFIIKSFCLEVPVLSPSLVIQLTLISQSKIVFIKRDFCMWPWSNFYYKWKLSVAFNSIF